MMMQPVLAFVSTREEASKLIPYFVAASSIFGCSIIDSGCDRKAVFDAVTDFSDGTVQTLVVVGKSLHLTGYKAPEGTLVVMSASYVQDSSPEELAQAISREKF